MRFNVSQIVRETSGSTRQYPFEERVALGGDVVVVEGSARFVRTDRGVWVTAPLRARVSLECGRCLESYEHSVEAMIDEEAVMAIDPLTGARHVGDGAEEERIVIDERHALDLIDAAAQYLALGLPMRPLCRRDCAGLCEGCGINRNRESCGCGDEQLDSRWGPLLEALPNFPTMEPSKN